MILALARRAALERPILCCWRSTATAHLDLPARAAREIVATITELTAVQFTVDARENHATIVGEHLDLDGGAVDIATVEHRVPSTTGSR